MGFLRGAAGAFEQRASGDRRSFPVRIGKQVLPREGAQVKDGDTGLTGASPETAPSRPTWSASSPRRGKGPHMSSVNDHKEFSRPPPGVGL